MNSLISRLTQFKLWYLPFADFEWRQRARLVQLVAGVLSGVAFVYYLMRFWGIGVEPDSTALQFHARYSLFLATAVLLLALVSFYRLQKGRLRSTAHFFFIGFNLAVFIEFLANTQPSPFPYLFLISIIAIAFVDSVRASVIYAGMSLAAVAVGTAMLGSETFDFLQFFILVAAFLIISLTAWLTAVTWQRQTDSLRHRANQLENDNNRLLSQIDIQVKQLDIIHRFTQSLSMSPTLRDVFAGVRREIFDLVKATGMSISLLTPEKDFLLWIYGFEYGEEVDLTETPPIPSNQGFSGQVVATKDVFLIQQDIDKLQKELKSTTVGAMPAVWLGLPLIVANELIGVLAIENEEPFTEGELETLKTIAGPAAIAIKNLLQLEQIQESLAAQMRQRLLLQTASEVAAAAATILDVDELLQQSVDLIQERFSLYYVGLFLVDKAAKEAVLRAGTGKAGREQLAENRRLAVGGRSLVGGATQDGESRIIQDVYQDNEWLPNPHLPDTRSELALPMRARGEIIGALTVQSEKPDAFSDEQIGILQAMGDQLAVAIENVRLLNQAERRAQSQQLLNEISQKLHRSPDVNEIIGMGLRALSEGLGGATVRLQLHRQTVIEQGNGDDGERPGDD